MPLPTMEMEMEMEVASIARYIPTRYSFNLLYIYISTRCSDQNKLLISFPDKPFLLFCKCIFHIKDEGLRVDSDVVRERDMVLNNQVPPTTAVTVENLRYLLFSFYLFLSFFQISFESLSSSSSYLVGYCYYNII